MQYFLRSTPIEKKKIEECIIKEINVSEEDNEDSQSLDDLSTYMHRDYNLLQPERNTIDAEDNINNT